MSKQYEMIKSLYNQAVIDNSLERVSIDYALTHYQGTTSQRLENAGKIRPDIFMQFVQINLINQGVSIHPNTIDRTRRKLEQQWPSNS